MRADPGAEFIPLSEQISRRQLWLLMATLMISLFISSLNQQIVATATPRILADLGGFGLLSWMFTIYMLTSTIVAPIVGKLSDTFGRKPFLLAGMIVFVLASAGCGLSNSMPMLIAFRGLQGIGGGLMQASIVTTIGDLFTPIDRAKYVSLFIAGNTVASVSGPTVGGLLTDGLGWRWCFFASVPVAVVAFGFVMAYLPQRRMGGPNPRVDVLGATLLAVASTLLLVGLVWTQKEYGWSHVQTIGTFAAAAAFTGLFILQERRHPEAILPLHLFGNRDFFVGTMVFMLMGCAMQGTIAYLPTFVQVALGASATASGLITTPQAVSALVGSFIGGQLLSRTGHYRVQVILGLGIVLAATVLLQTLNVGDPEWHIIAFMVVLGLGSGVVTTTMSVVVLNAVSPRYMGVASGSRQFFQQIGIVVSTAVFGVILASSYQSTFTDQLSAQARSVLPTDAVVKFQDPTLTLDEKRYGQVREAVLPLAGGREALAAALAASREGVAVANRHIFLGATMITLFALFWAFIQREIPLRGGPSARAAGAPPSAPVEAPGPSAVAAEADG